MPEQAYRVKLKPSDRPIYLGNMPTADWSLGYIIVVREFSVPFVKHWALNSRSINFTHFAIDLLWTYMRLPTTGLGDQLFFATMQELVDGEVSPGLRIVDPRCPPPYRMAEFQDEALTILAREGLRKMVRIARQAGTEISLAEENQLVMRPVLMSGTMDAA